MVVESIKRRPGFWAAIILLLFVTGVIYGAATNNLVVMFIFAIPVVIIALIAVGISLVMMWKEEA